MLKKYVFKVLLIFFYISLYFRKTPETPNECQNAPLMTFIEKAKLICQVSRRDLHQSGRVRPKYPELRLR